MKIKKKKRSNKGRPFENKICKLLSLNWSDGERDDIFHHTDNSGGRFTTRKKKNLDTAFQGGDIGFNDPHGKSLIDYWNIECKTGYGVKRKTDKGLVKTNWCILDLIDSKQEKTQFEQFWEQCVRDADLTDREPILIFRRNNKSICIAFYRSYLNKLINFYSIPSCNYLEINFNVEIVIFNFKEFLAWIKCIKTFIEGKLI